MTICILCKVIDNFGDAGFAWRLANALLQKRKSLDLRFISDNLKTLSSLESKINIHKKKQIVHHIAIYDWNETDFCEREFQNENDLIILQCFQCSYPIWLEKILFETKTISRAFILNIDYLTAENYADEFHLLASLTRRSAVKKINFMPGFTNKTAGLIFRETNDTLHSSARKKKLNILFFSYERNCCPIVNAFSYAQKICKKKFYIHLAYGTMQKKFFDCAEKTEEKFAIKKLSFLSQKKWDKFLKTFDILFVRGEDSLASACLLGAPFIWEAYAQAENYELVKVRSLLEKMKLHFSEHDFEIVERAWILYNDKNANANEVERALCDFLVNAENLHSPFFSFAKELKTNGDFAENLLSFLETASY